MLLILIYFVVFQILNVILIAFIEILNIIWINKKCYINVLRVFFVIVSGRELWEQCVRGLEQHIKVLLRGFLIARKDKRRLKNQVRKLKKKIIKLEQRILDLDFVTIV